MTNVHSENKQFTVEAAVPADIPGIVAIVEENLLVNKDASAVGRLEQSGFLIARHSAADLGRWIADKENHLVLVGKEGREIVGYILGCDWEALALEMRLKFEEVQALKSVLTAQPVLYHKQVAIKSNRKGVGSRLLQRFFEVAAQKNYQQIVCMIVHEPVVNKASVAFHQKHGFECLGSVRFSEMGNGVYLKRLGRNKRLKITYIADPEVLMIPIVECHEPLVDIKNQSELLYGPPPECELTANCYTKLRKTVFEKLLKAQRALPRGWRFRVYEGFRSLAVQELLFEGEYQRVLGRHPKAGHEACFYEATRQVSPLFNLDGSKNTPPHNTGAAVDLEIIGEDGRLMDMGMTAKDWSAVHPDLCLTDSLLVSETTRQNRKLLLEVMQAQGFVNYPTEWWHFSYGDRYWAYQRKADCAIYGSVEGLI